MIRMMRSVGMRLRPAGIALVLAIGFMVLAGTTQSQEGPTFTVLYSGTAGRGTDPIALLPGPDGVLYGTAADTGNCFCGGVLFKLSANDTESVLHLFDGQSDGLFPVAGLVRDSDGNLYGTTLNGGGSTACKQACGIVFRVNQWGTETVLHRFAGGSSGGANPHGPVVLDTEGNLYGTTLNGGAYGLWNRV
jgi:uncharacterized repeat protein (TIGR03803 family)